MSNIKIDKKPIVLITHPGVPKPGLDLLENVCDIRMCDKVPTELDDILEKCNGVDAIFWACHVKLDERVLNVAGDRLKIISTMSAGLDYVDIPCLQSRNIILGHTPKILSEAVADIAIGLLLAASRRFCEARIKIETSKWDNYSHDWLLGVDIAGSTVGFVGFGDIGQLIAKRLTGFDVGKYLYTCRNPKAEADKFNAKFVSFDDLLNESDIIIVVCPLTAETTKMFNEDAFNKMKSNCVFINIARGKIVDQEALYNALKSNKIFAAGLDVMDPEPLPADNPLLALPNCVITPHIGSATARTRNSMSILAAKNILEALQGNPMIAPAY